MAKLIREDNFDGKIETEEREVNDNDNGDLIDKAEELGIAFGCQDGRCGSCRVEVIEGMDNLTEKSINEDDVLGSGEDSENYRLMCQCKIKSRLVKIRI